MSETIKCIIENRLQTKKGSKFSFKNLDTGAEGKAITFDEFDASWLGEQAQFEAKYNEKFKNYQIVGGITILGGEVAPTTVATPAVETPPAPAKRGRPAKAVAPEVVTDQARELAVDLVRENIVSAQALAKELKLKPTDDAVITLADMVGRTRVSLRIEAGKNQRMKDFRK